MEQNPTELAKALLDALQKPVEIVTIDHNIQRAALPPGWTVHERDDVIFQDRPRRRTGKIDLTTSESFIDYINRHSIQNATSVYCDAQYDSGQVKFLAVINDHQAAQPDRELPEWRDHLASFSPKGSVEWSRWHGTNKQSMSQIEFALFIEENLRDIASVDGMPTGQQLLEMALSFEANQDMRFKSAARLQNGGIQMSFVQDDDSQTLAKMQMFDKISIGIPVFWSGDAYRIDARLRYRVRDGKLFFWYELIRPDKVIEDATKTLIDTIREKTGTFFYFGDPGLNK